MKLTLNKKALKNLSKDNQILPDEVTPQIGGGMTAAATCPATAPETQCNCAATDYACVSDSCQAVISSACFG